MLMVLFCYKSISFIDTYSSMYEWNDMTPGIDFQNHQQNKVELRRRDEARWRAHRWSWVTGIAGFLTPCFLLSCVLEAFQWKLSLDGPTGYCGKWNKSDRERQTPYDFTYMWNLKNKKKTNKQNRNRLTDTENRLMVARVGEGWGNWVKKVKGLRSTNWQLQNSHGNTKYSIGNTVNNSVMTTCGYV